jgi:KUP system potassium uptake protein
VPDRVYLTSRLDMVPVHFSIIRINVVLRMAEHVATETDRITPEERIQTTHLGDNFHSVRVRYGFMEHPNIPQVLDDCRSQKLDFNMMDTSFFVGRVTIVAGRHSRLSGFRRQVFDFMHRNALPATEFFRIPPGRVIELGGRTRCPRPVRRSSISDRDARRRPNFVAGGAPREHRCA